MLMLPEERTVSREVIKEQIDAALGKIAADLYVTNVKILDVYTDTIFDGSFLVKHQKIVNINPTFSPQARRVVDGRGMFAVPGFIDPCTHIDCSLVMPDALSEGYVPWGTTTVVGEINDLAAAQGPKGADAVRAYLKDREKLPFRMLCLAPGKGVPYEQTAALLQEPGIAGQGENQGAFTLDGEPNTLDKVVHNRVGQIFTNGHVEPFANSDEIGVFAICGSVNDHEAWTFDAVFNRHRRGIPTQILYMQGWEQFDLMIRQIILDRHLPTSNFMFAGDNTYIQDMVSHGILNTMVERAISLGLSPVDAIKMATFHPARNLGLEQHLGSITPGRYADFILLRDLRDIKPVQVYKGGVLVAEAGRLVNEVHIDYDFFAQQTFPQGYTHLSVDDLRELFSVKGLPHTPDGSKVLVPGISRVPEDYKKTDVRFADGSCLLDLWAPCKDGYIQCDPETDIAKVLFVERYAHNGVRRTARRMYRGFGMTQGALVMPHLTQIEGYVILGTNESDMLKALQVADQYNGAVVLVCDGQVEVCFDLNYAGMISSSDAKTVTAAVNHLTKLLQERGCTRKQVLVDLWTAGFPLKHAPYFDI